MKILVCVKQVPVAEGAPRIDRERNRLEFGNSAEFVMNRYDEFAVEEAVLLKEAHPGTEIDIVSVGPPRAAAAIKRGLSMGADRGIHLLTAEEEGYLGAVVTASRIAAFAAGKGYHLILAGVMSEDAMQGQVGPMVAEMLGFPCATSVIAIEVSAADAVVVRREVEGGCRERLELLLPALVSVQSGINKPRYPSFSNIMRTRNVPLAIIEADELGGETARERVLAVGDPPRTRSGETLAGTAQEKAARLLEILERKVPMREESL